MNETKIIADADGDIYEDIFKSIVESIGFNEWELSAGSDDIKCVVEILKQDFLLLCSYAKEKTLFARLNTATLELVLNH